MDATRSLHSGKHSSFSRDRGQRTAANGTALRSIAFCLPVWFLQQDFIPASCIIGLWLAWKTFTILLFMLSERHHHHYFDFRSFPDRLPSFYDTAPLAANAWHVGQGII